MLAAVAVVWQGQFHPFTLISAALLLASLPFDQRFKVGRIGLGLGSAAGLLLCFLCTRLIGMQSTGFFLGIGSMSLALLSLWLTAASVTLQRSGLMGRAPIALASATLVFCSMSLSFLSVGALALPAIGLLALAMREAMGLQVQARHLSPLILSLALTSILVVAARWSENRFATLLNIFTLVPPSGVSFPLASSLSSLQRWNNSDLVVLRGYGEGPPPQYLVGRTFHLFDASSFWRWQTTKVELTADARVQVTTREGPKEISQFQKSDSQPGAPFRLEYPRAGSGLSFYLPRRYASVACDLPRLHLYSDGLVQVLAKDELAEGEYFVFPFADGWSSPEPVALLSPKDRDLYLQLPDNLTPEVARLAREVAGEVDSPHLKAEAVTNYFQRNFKYGYDFPFKSNQTALEEFLLERPPAHCEFFATAAALMLRSQGVPTRYINGFVLQERSLAKDYYVVRLKHAHAWLEAYIPEVGWVVYDPTPPGTLGDPNDHAEVTNAIVEYLSNKWRHFLDFFTLSPGEMLAALKRKLASISPEQWLKLGGLVALYGGFRLYLRRRSKPKTKKEVAAFLPGRDPILSPLLDQVSGAAGRWGRHPAETPEEWGERLFEQDLPKSVREELARFIALYTRLRYGSGPSEEETKKLQALTQSLSGRLNDHLSKILQEAGEK